jgi:uncharacterized protein (TIGR02145 family)
MPPKHLALAILLIAFTAHSGDNTITYANKTYKTVQIGEQVWFAENLNYDAEGCVCYGNNPANCAKHGRLYNWETALKVCPEGWHLPSIAEWDKLFRFIDGTKGTESPYDSKTAGKHLKAASGWNHDGNGTDNYGFSALPGGYGIFGGRFDDADYGYWWSSSWYNDYHAYYYFIYYYEEKVFSGVGGKKSLFFGVRCVKD